MPFSSCPVCDGRNFVAAVPAGALRQEVEERNRFVSSRLRRRAPRSELKDLTDFMHGGDAAMSACSACGLLVRLEAYTRAADSYSEDPNDPGVMQHLYPRYVEAFRNKAAAFRDRLPPHASVVEIGPHLGGFLQAAEEWDWRPVGLDVGVDTSEFARRQGLTVRRETVEDTHIRAGSANGVFIWNCFEQLADPSSTLKAARNLLRHHGLLVLRVPNASAWLTLRRQPDLAARQILAWNNLLGFPYLHGYGVSTLTRIARRHGFEPVREFPSELVTMPFPDPARDVEREQASVSQRSQDVGVAPWTEILFRREDEITRCTANRGPFLSRA
ncbi:MAG: methyltransferase domain-containing protein [Bryobacteraceae bacterium]|nr:methyltransferase domain-containing protein [Bryobacteraceae bacterium]